MAASEPWDFLSTGVLPDTTVELNLTARGILAEHGVLNQVVHLSDAGGTAEEVVTLSTVREFFLDVPWNNMDESDSGTIFNFWANATLGDGKGRRFPLVHAYGTQTHTYISRFDSNITRDIMEGNIHRSSARFKLFGRAS